MSLSEKELRQKTPAPYGEILEMTRSEEDTSMKQTTITKRTLEPVHSNTSATIINATQRSSILYTDEEPVKLPDNFFRNPNLITLTETENNQLSVACYAFVKDYDYDISHLSSTLKILYYAVINDYLSFDDIEYLEKKDLNNLPFDEFGQMREEYKRKYPNRRLIQKSE